MKYKILLLSLVVPILLSAQTRRLWVDSLFVRGSAGDYRKVSLAETFGDTSLTGLDSAGVYNWIKNDFSDSINTVLGSDRVAFNSKSLVFGVANTTALAALTDTNQVFIPGIGRYIYQSSGYTQDGYGIVTATGVGSGIWVHEDILYHKEINPRIYGATGDGDADDTAEIEAAEAAALTLNLPLNLGDGTYKMTSNWELGSANNVGFRIIGNGANRTVLKFIGCNGIYIPTGQKDNIVISDLAVIGDGTAGTRGLNIYNLTGGEFKNVQIDSFQVSVFIQTSEDNLFRNVYSNSTFADTGLYIYSNANGNIFMQGGLNGNYVNYYSESCHGNSFYNIDQSGTILYEAAVISDMSIYGGQNESIGTTVVKADNSSSIDYFGGRTQGNSGAVLSYQTGANRVCFWNHDFTYAVGGGVNSFASDSLVWLENANAEFYYRGHRHGQSFFAYVANRSDFKPIGEMLYTRKTGFGGETAYKLRQITPLVGETGQSDVVYGQHIASGTTFTNYLSDGTDWRYDTNGLDSVHALRQDRIRHYYGKVSGSTSAGDSTEVTVQTDTSGIDNFYYLGGTVDRTSPDGTVFNAYITQKSYNATTGAITFIIWHTSDTGGSIAYRVNYHIIVQAKATGQW